MKKSINNMEDIKKFGMANCYFCFRVWITAEIFDTCDNGKTALCPRCDMDTLLAGAWELEDLERLHTKYFKRVK